MFKKQQHYSHLLLDSSFQVHMVNTESDQCWVGTFLENTGLENSILKQMHKQFTVWHKVRLVLPKNTNKYSTLICINKGDIEIPIGDLKLMMDEMHSPSPGQ